jgi:ATP synthase protein I
MSEPSQDDLDRKRAALEDELRAKRPPAPSRPESEQSPQIAEGVALGQAMRISTEFIAGLAVGAALGYGADQLLGTSPWGLILFFMLGFVASVMNAFRAAGLAKPRNHRED